MVQESLTTPLFLVLLVAVVILAHFKQVGPEISCGSFGLFRGPCRLYCTRNCALVLHSQAASPEGVYLNEQNTMDRKSRHILEAFKNGILKTFYKVRLFTGNLGFLICR
jgi:hypothetical protein